MRARIGLLALLAIAATLLTACDGTASDRALVDDFIDEWARAKGINPVTEEGGLDLGGLVNLGTTMLTGKSGDDEIDAILAAIAVIEAIDRADELMDQARAARDGQLMEEAIALRPHDPTYRFSRGALGILQGDLSAHSDNFSAGMNRLGEGPSAVGFLNQAIDDYEDAEDAVGLTEPMSAEQCRALYNSLSDLYFQRGQRTGSTDDLAMADGYHNQAGHCD